MQTLFSEGPPRESFRRFPSWVQPIITFLCGKPIRGEQPFVKIGPVIAVGIDLLKLVLGVGCAVICIRAGDVFLIAIPLCWIITVNAIRSLASDAHYAGHVCVTGFAVVDNGLGELLSMLALSTNMKAYARGHNTRHHGPLGIGTLDDPDITLMLLMGFEAGRSVRWYRRRLCLSLFSPRYHCLYTWYRLRSNFTHAPFLRIGLSWLFHGSMLAIALYFDFFPEYMIAWLIPAFPLVAISAALQFPSEHLWLSPRLPDEAAGVFLRRISHGRFFLAAPPRHDLPLPKKIIAWTAWLIIMIQPVIERFYVCVSILPAHDFHHRKPRLLDWPMEPYLRQYDIDSGATDYHEFYGLSSAYNAQFKIWSKLPTNLFKPRFTFLRYLAIVWLKITVL